MNMCTGVASDNVRSEKKKRLNSEGKCPSFTIKN